MSCYSFAYRVRVQSPSGILAFISSVVSLGSTTKKLMSTALHTALFGLQQAVLALCSRCSLQKADHNSHMLFAAVVVFPAHMRGTTLPTSDSTLLVLNRYGFPFVQTLGSKSSRDM